MDEPGFTYHKRFSSLNKSESPLVEYRFERARSYRSVSSNKNNNNETDESSSHHDISFPTKRQVLKVNSQEGNQGIIEERFLTIGLGKTRSYTRRTMSFTRKKKGLSLIRQKYCSGEVSWSKKTYDHEGLFGIQDFKINRVEIHNSDDEQDESNLTHPTHLPLTCGEIFCGA